ncbi:MAG: leucyl aminopeptidase family protein [Phycisphaeraceae bacterium]|nr:leucyl aminopeptidase family protein [Phycisphaeraceae bacterium]
MFQSVRVAASAPESADALVVGVFKPANAGAKSKQAPKPALDDSTARKLDDATRAAIDAALQRAESTGDAGQVIEAFPSYEGARRKGVHAARVFVLGLGEPTKLDAEAMRSAAAGVGKRLAGARCAKAHFELHHALSAEGVTLKADKAGQCVGEAIGLLGFTFDHYRGTVNNKKERVGISLSSSLATFTKGMSRGVDLAESANFSRFLSNTPPNVATPAWMADQCRDMAKKVKGLTVKVMQGATLERERLMGLVTVGQASINKPCMIRIEYTPAKPKKGARPLVLIGKTLTYDTGGLSLKISNGMRGMKGDKDGGCAVIGAMHAIATVVKPDFPVVALLAAAENSVNENAYRPDDCMTFRNGVTVEVTNTDAEGRLVLADALCWACEKEDPRAIIDLATLTGGVITALGSTFAGMWCDDDKLRGAVECASASAGERVWRLPLHKEYRDLMKSSIADIVNSAPVRDAHPIQGAAFLSYFVTEGTPWCHLDVAGVHRVTGESGPYAKDTPTGFGVRLLAELCDAM